MANLLPVQGILERRVLDFLRLARSLAKMVTDLQEKGNSVKTGLFRALRLPHNIVA
jgi:hypothetical protein